MVKVWAYAGGLGKHKPPSKGEKAAITAACEKLIADVLKPLYLQKIVPTEYNYPVDIFGKWLGNKYRFIVPSGRIIQPQRSQSSTRHSRV